MQLFVEQNDSVKSSKDGMFKHNKSPENDTLDIVDKADKEMCPKHHGMFHQ